MVRFKSLIPCGVLALSLGGVLGAGTVRAVKVEQAPVLDGRVIEEAWAAASPAGSFVQQRPLEGEPATEKTEVRFLYSGNALYIGVICFDSDPEGVMDTQSRRDGDLTDSDSISIILDTFHDRQNGLLFATNPAGIEYDAQIQTEGIAGGQISSTGVGRSVTSSTTRGNVSAVNVNWDVAWKVKSSRTERGWESEMEIPLKSLRFKDSSEPQTWGVNISRNVRRKNEQSFWAPIPQAYSLYRVSMAGELEGLEIHAERNLKVIPYAIWGPVKDYSGAKPKTAYKKDTGLDVKYSLTSTLTLDATVNTDFATVEADDEQINLTRFDLFFPEKRPFFLENAGTFAFGTPSEMDLFFSRRIGIDGGREVSIPAGARVTGKIDRFSLGLLSIQTGEEEGFASAQNFSVARLRREFHKRSSAGVIFTNRQNVGTAVGHTDYNRAWGADMQLGLTESVIVSAYLAKTHSPNLKGNDKAGNIYAGYRTNLWRLEGLYTDIQSNFNPEVGFVPRKGFRKPEFKIYFSPSPKSGWIRQWNPHVTQRRYYGPDGKLESMRGHYDMEILKTDGGSMSFTLNRDYEFLREPFSVYPGVVIPVGGYTSNQFQFSYATNPSKNVFGDYNLTRGGYYGGDLMSNDAEVGFRTGPNFVATVGFVNTQVDAPWGHFNTNLGRLKANYSFTPLRFIQAFIQYNSRNSQVSSNIRAAFLKSSGTGLYIVYNERYDTPADRFEPANRAFFVKYSYEFDF